MDSVAEHEDIESTPELASFTYPAFVNPLDQEDAVVRNFILARAFVLGYCSKGSNKTDINENEMHKLLQTGLNRTSSLCYARTVNEALKNLVTAWSYGVAWASMRAVPSELPNCKKIYIQSESVNVNA